MCLWWVYDSSLNMNQGKREFQRRNQRASSSYQNQQEHPNHIHSKRERKSQTLVESLFTSLEKTAVMPMDPPPLISTRRVEDMGSNPIECVCNLPKNVKKEATVSTS